MHPIDLTIAITVYDRRQFIAQAIESALNQTIPVPVIVVEDCGPDPGLRQYVLERFGSRIRYVRNPARLGLFGNWNSCIEAASTRWLSILHDDDFLRPDFVASWVEWRTAAPDRGLYFGGFEAVNEAGAPVPYPRPEVREPWQEIDLHELARSNTLGFPGQVFDARLARSLGGFRQASQFCGDWEMWFRLVLERGGVQSPRIIASVRFYDDPRRGTSKVVRSGRCFALTVVQRRRNERLMPLAKAGSLWRDHSIRAYKGPFASYLLEYGAGFSTRLLRYNTALLLESDTSGWGTGLLRIAARLGGAPLIRLLSRTFGRVFHRRGLGRHGG